MTIGKIARPDREQIRKFMHGAARMGTYLTVVAGVLDSMTGNAAAQTDSGGISGYSLIAYILGIGIILVAIMIIRMAVTYYNKLNYDSGLEKGKETGREELLQEQVEEELIAEEEEEEEEEEAEEEKKEDIDYDMVMEDMDKYRESLGDEDKEQPIIQNINKFVTGYKFLKPPDVAVLSLTKRFDEYEVAIALPEKRKGASKISEFIPFEENVRKEIQDEFDGVSQLNNSMVVMPNMGGMGPIITTRLDNLGKKITESFIPQNVLKNLQTIKDPIIIETNDGELLWETIHDGNDFIALQHPIGRVLKTKEEARTNPFERGDKLRFLLISNPTGDLESTEKEANYIESLLKQKAIIDKLSREEATKENILAALGSGKYDVIHYAGHADSESEGEAALVTASGLLFSSDIKRTIAGRPYVYLNACGSGREAMEESKDYTKVSDTEGLASAFILGGAVGFMGAMWRLPDKSAAEFAVNFYDGLIENLKVGEACRKARLEIRKQNPSDITWAAFLQYGDPVQRLREKKTEEEKAAQSDEEVEEDAEIEVVEEGEGEEERAEAEEAEEEKEEEKKVLTEEERLKQYQGWIMGGLEHMRNKKYEDAITAFDTAIGLDPERYNAWHLTGNALRELKRYNEAIECYDKAVERDATVDEIWYDKALALGAIGRFDEAMDCKTTLESLKVGRVKEWLKKADELSARGGTREALKIYERILKDNEKYPLAWYLKGNAHAELGETAAALDCYERSLKFAKNFSRGHYRKAELLNTEKRYEDAGKSIDAALELNPLHEDALVLKSDILTALGSYKSALQTIDRALAINNSNADALLRKADILRRYKKSKEALDCYNQIIKLNPEHVQAWYWKSVLLNELGTSAEDELECYRQLMNLEVDDPNILKGVGEALESKEDIYEDKLKWYEKMILYNPNTVRAWLNKGLALEGSGNTEAAIDAYHQTIELDEKNVKANERLARIYEQNDETDLAIRYYHRLTELDPSNSAALLELAKLQRRIGQNKDALNNFLALYKLDHDNTEVLSNLRDLYYSLDQKKNAMTVSRRLLKLMPDDIDTNYHHAKLLYDFKNYPELIQYTDKLMSSRGDDMELLVMRAEAFSNLQKMDRALECWDRIIALQSKQG